MRLLPCQCLATIVIIVLIGGKEKGDPVGIQDRLDKGDLLPDHFLLPLHTISTLHCDQVHACRQRLERSSSICSCSVQL
jgi:hypothetical protein